MQFNNKKPTQHIPCWSRKRWGRSGDRENYSVLTITRFLEEKATPQTQIEYKGSKHKSQETVQVHRPATTGWSIEGVFL
jgi:hypothetical protein